MTKENKAITAFIIGAFLLLAIAWSGCKVQAIPTTDHKDSVRVEYRLDSVYVYERDSIYIDRWRTGDTIYITTEKLLTRYKDKMQVVHDTINSIQEREIVVTEKVTPKWAWWSLIACICLVAGIVVRIVIKIYTRR